jgi:hypothetical protein
MSEMLQEVLDTYRRFTEPQAFVACHPDDQWEVREAFARMTPMERAQFVFNVTPLVESGQVFCGKIPGP